MIDSLLLIGRTTGMEEIVSLALQSARSARFFQSIDEALSEEFNPELIVVLQHWPDEYSPTGIRQLMSRFPIARTMVCQGPWCASDRRTRQFWPAAMCVFVEAAPQRIANELEVIAGQRPPLPWTAGLDEIFVFDHGI